MKKLNNKGFTLVELLAVIVVLAIVMALAVGAITGVVENARKKSFVTDAQTFLEGARNLVTTQDVSGFMSGSTSTTYCGSSSITKIIPIGAIPLQQGGVKSPYGNEYTGNRNSDDAKTTIWDSTTDATDIAEYTGSFVQVTSTARDASGNCTYTYSIYLSDSIYNIGTKAVPLRESTFDTSNVILIGG